MVSDEGKFNPNTTTETTTQGASDSNAVLYGNSLEDAYANGLERAASNWRIFALARLGRVRDKMPAADVEVVQRFLGVDV